MAKNPKTTNLAANAATNAMTVLANSGYLRGYSGTQPATADTAITSQVLLFTLRFNATAFGSAALGVATANAIVSDSDAAATGTGAWFRCFESDGTTAIWDGSIGVGTFDLALSTTAIVQHQVVSCASYTFTQSKG